MSAIPYNVTQATRHPAIWMGERGSIAIVPGGALEGNVAKIGQFLKNVAFLWIPILKEVREEMKVPHTPLSCLIHKGGHALVEQIL